MTATPALPDPATAFAGLPATAERHLALHLLAAVLRVAGLALRWQGSAEAALARFPFLGAWLDQVAAHGLGGAPLETVQRWWLEAIVGFERRTGPVPLRRLMDGAGLEREAVVLLAALALPEEDARFGPLFEALQESPGLRRPTPALAAALFPEGAAGLLRRLREWGLVEVPGEAERGLRPVPLLWEALRGEAPEAGSWAEYRPLGALPRLGALLLEPETAAQLARIAGLLARGGAQALVLRGPRRNGRGTVLGAVAAELGRGVLRLSAPPRPEDPLWRQAGTLAVLLGAMPCLALDLGPGEAREVPALPGGAGPLGIALGTQGAVTGAGLGQALTLALPLPGPETRQRLWRRGLGDGNAAPTLEALRMSSGNILRAAALARAAARAEGTAVGPRHIGDAARALDRTALDGLAQRLETPVDWNRLALGEETGAELRALLARCRHRERLGGLLATGAGGEAPSCGIRALFRGPSGTGKTLAAKLVAGSLGLDLYRADLSGIVDKYIGETEKNLERLLGAAEELGILLLLDEGDALLTQRTGVQSAHDRYANIETNYLLQRLESFQGILVVTTNAGDRIDTAFQRRMDAILDFSLPDAQERHRILELHLPAGHHIPPALLAEVAQRCALAGGQIRNAVIHATLLALEESRGGGPEAHHLRAAVAREYRKQGAVSPLRPRAA
jgi:hypothetical protein